MPGGSWVEGRLWVIDSNGEKKLVPISQAHTYVDDPYPWTDSMVVEYAGIDEGENDE
jgi:hypothetical protein